MESRRNGSEPWEVAWKRTQSLFYTRLYMLSVDIHLFMALSKIHSKRTTHTRSPGKEMRHHVCTTVQRGIIALSKQSCVRVQKIG